MNRQWQVLSAFSVADDSLVTGRQEIPPDWPEAFWIPYSLRKPTRGEQDELLPFLQWEYLTDSIEELDVREGFEAGESPLPEGRGPYWLQINVWDIYNRQYASELIPVSVRE